MDRKFLVKLGITLSLLAYLAFKVDWSLIKATISNLRLLPFFSSYLILLLCSIPLAFRLRILLKPTVLQFSLKRLIQVQFISQLYSLLLPSGIGVSIARWYKITQNRLGRRVFVVITLIERVMLSMTLLLCTGIPLLLSKDEAIQSFRSSVLPIIFLLIFGCFFFFSFFLHPWVYEKFSLTVRGIQSRFSSGLPRRILGVYEDCGLYVDKRHLLVKSFAYHLLFQALNFLRFYLVFVALGVDLPFITILWISALVLLILSLPITIAGFGLREMGFAWVLALYGIDPERGVILGGMISLQVFLNIGIGAILNMLEK
jgi:uncharacterized protein (TIRG00374 family)